MTLKWNVDCQNVLILKRGNVIRSEEVVMSDGKMVKCIAEGCGYKYLRILVTGGVRHNKTNEQIRKEYIRR